MNKSTDTNTQNPKSRTPEEIAFLEELAKIQAKRKETEDWMRSQGMTEQEILYETTEL